MDGNKKSIVITGASSGIGAALSVQLGQQGQRLVLGARRQRELREVAARAAPDALAVRTDVTRLAEVERLRDRALQAFGRVDVWINNAGRGISRSVLELTDEEFDEMMAVNVKSALYGMQAIVPQFIERGHGHLINVSSFLGRVPLVAYRSAYNAAKAALNALTANLRMELAGAHPGIQVSLVMPGVVRTAFARNALGGTPVTAGGTPEGQTAEEVAAVIVGLIEHPVPEIYTNPAQGELAARYFGDVASFERHLREAGRP